MTVLTVFIKQDEIRCKNG